MYTELVHLNKRKRNNLIKTGRRCRQEIYQKMLKWSTDVRRLLNLNSHPEIQNKNHKRHHHYTPELLSLKRLTIPTVDKDIIHPKF